MSQDYKLSKASKRCKRSSSPNASKQTDNAITFGNCIHVSDRYEKVGRIGEGTYGVVYKAKDKTNGSFVALKRCIPHHESSDGFPITTLREIHALRTCGAHPNIVQLHTVAVSRSGVFLVFEYCRYDLACLLDKHYRTHRNSPFRLDAVKTLLQQLLSALAYIHARHLVHRDLKVSNLLYHQGTLKLADFGLSRSIGRDSILTTKVASLWYRPIELLLGAVVYDQAIDLWPVGCIFGELLQGRPIMNGQTDIDQISLVFEWIGVPPNAGDYPLVKDGKITVPDKSQRRLLDTFSYLSNSGLQLMASMFELDPQKRVTASHALQSKFFEESPAPRPIEKMPYHWDS